MTEDEIAALCGGKKAAQRLRKRPGAKAMTDDRCDRWDFDPSTPRLAATKPQEQIKELRKALDTAIRERNEYWKENERLRRRIDTLEGMLGEMNVAVPDDRALEPKP